MFNNILYYSNTIYDTINDDIYKFNVYFNIFSYIN